MQLTEIDRLLIRHLRENARISTTDLARRADVSRTTVQNRIERLEREGVIAGYTLKYGPAYERALVRAHIMITASPKASQAIEAELRGMDEVRALHSVSGEYDMIADVAAGSVAEIDAAIDRIGLIDGVERTMSSVLLSTKIDR